MTEPSSAVPARCVRVGLMMLSRCSSPWQGLELGLWTTVPSGLYETSSPGADRRASYTSGLRPHGGPGSDRGLPVGNSRQTSRPLGWTRSAMRLAQRGRASGGRAHRNCGLLVSRHSNATAC